MAKIRYKTLEKPSGEGEVYKGAQYLSQVIYSLHVRQEIHITETFGNKKDEIPGHIGISGKVKILEGERDLMVAGQQLSLHLSDGRNMDFFAKKGDPVSGVYTIRPMGSKGLTN